MATRYQCGNQKALIEVIGIFWPLYRLSYFDLCLLITPLLYVGHCIVCPISINAF
jgi:hypothetical protein